MGVNPCSNGLGMVGGGGGGGGGVSMSHVEFKK